MLLSTVLLYVLCSNSSLNMISHGINASSQDVRVHLQPDMLSVLQYTVVQYAVVCSSCRRGDADEQLVCSMCSHAASTVSSSQLTAHQLSAYSIQ